MFSINKTLKLTVLVSAMCTAGSAFSVASGSIVNDPIHTMQSYYNTLQLIQGEVTRYKALQTQLEQLKQYADINSWKGKSDRELGVLRNYISGLESIHGSVNSNAGRLQQRLNEAAMNKLSLQEYGQLEAKRIQAGNSDAIRRQDADIKDMKKTAEDYEDIKQWENDIKDKSTEIDSARMMNQQLNKIVAMNAQTTKTMLASRIETRDDRNTDRAADSNYATKILTEQEARFKKNEEIHKKARAQIPSGL